MPFCGHCKNIGKEYTSHFPRKTISQNSQLTCPELLKNVCTKCSSRNHTYDKCNKKKIETSVAPPSVNKSNTSKYNILVDEEDKCPICQCVECYCDNDYLENKMIQTPGEELYAIIAKDYPYRAGKITGMILELDEAEIVELLVNPALLKERTKEASDLIDANCPWGFVDMIFVQLNSDKQVRQELWARVYAINPKLHSSIINHIVEYFLRQRLTPEQTYKLFSDFEAFKREVNRVYNDIMEEEDNDEEEERWECDEYFQKIESRRNDYEAIYGNV
jgi:hypothetical protein